ncbi:hypothetical protein K438DRAFT_1695780 [Mycena galopus ATCC 62051]|nr:hypothetical protein K438DRAFT_1695780 [Mycena galopus ATCC 62051]
MLFAAPSSAGASRAPHARATWSSEVSDTDSVTVLHPDPAPDPAIHAGLHDQGDNSQSLINHILGGQGGSGGGGGVDGGSGGTGHGPSFHYDIAAETVNVVSHVYQSPATVHTAQVLNHCPPPSRIFQGQQVTLDAMHQFFARDTGKQHIYVLYGLGGAGKTQIALKLIEEFTHFTDRFLVDASTTQTIETGLKNIALAKQIGNSSQDGLRWLAGQHEMWLLFFDNADDPKINLNRFFPKCNHGNIIVTSRNPNLRVYGAHSQVSDMKEADAVALLLKSAAQQTSPVNHSLAAKIVKMLWYLPLAIVQAGAFISESGAFDTYLDLYVQNRAKLLSEKPVQGHDEYAWTVFTTWQMSFDKLSPPAAIFLQLCSFIHRDGISEDIFSRAAHYLVENKTEYKPKKLQKLQAKFRRIWSQSQTTSKDMIENPRQFLSRFLGPTGKWDSLQFGQVTNEIKAYSLINFDAERKSFSIHPLVHDWSRTTLTKQDAAHLYMGEILGMSFQKILSEDMRLASLTLVSHVDALMRPIPPDVSRFGLQYARIYRHAGYYKVCKEFEEAVLQERQKHLGDNHLDTLQAMHSLANTCRNLGQLAESQTLQLVVLEKRRTLLGHDHPDTLDAMNNLAVTYNELGQFKEAEKLALVALETWRKIFGEDHLDTVRAVHALAHIYDNLGRFRDAERLTLMVLEKRRQLLGDVHLDTLEAMNSLAAIYYHLGQFEKAEALQVVVLEKRRNILGDDHLDTLAAINNLAATYNRFGHSVEAEKLNLFVLAKRRKLLGDHPETICAMNNLAWTYYCLAQFDKAEELQLAAIEKQRKLFSDTHPDTQFYMKSLARIYRGLNKHTEAEELENYIRKTKTKTKALSNQLPELPRPGAPNINTI